jgi:hypothetical protein
LNQARRLRLSGHCPQGRRAGATEKALHSLKQKHPKEVASISIGHDALDWYFEPGATVADRAGIWNIFKIPDGAKVQEEADKVLLRLREIAQKFGGFAGNFIWRHTR